MMKGRIRVSFYTLSNRAIGTREKSIDFDLLPEKRHLSDAEASHYSSLFVIRFPIAREREGERVQEKRLLYVTHEQRLSII
jgi:hypothetical protein